jgi:hypothetical protein
MDGQISKKIMTIVLKKEELAHAYLGIEIIATGEVFVHNLVHFQYVLINIIYQCHRKEKRKRNHHQHLHNLLSSLGGLYIYKQIDKSRLHMADKIMSEILKIITTNRIMQHGTFHVSRYS